MEIKWLDHQVKANEFLSNIYEKQGFAALFMETGTGKTPVALEQLERWVGQGLHPLLVVCPNTLTFNWVEEAKKFKSSLRVVRFPPGGREIRLKAIQSHDYDVLVVNYDCLRSLSSELIARGFKCIVFDELHRIKSRKAKQTKEARKIAANCRYRLGLTGTPVTQSPFDLWSQFDVLGAGFGHPLKLGSYTTYQKTIAHAEPHPHLGWKVPQYTFPTDKIQLLRHRVAPHVFQVTKEECLDLPPRSWQPIFVQMGDEQARVYEEMFRDSVSVIDEQIASKDLEAGISSTNLVLSQIIRLHQITSGFIRADDKELKELPNCKLEFLEEFLPTLLYGDRKACIWVRFRHDVDALIQALTKWEIPFVWVDGRNSKEIHSIVNSFRSDSSIKVFIAQVQVVREGLTLVEANSVIYFSNTHNLEWREQSQDRVYRYGQVREVTYYDLIALRKNGKPSKDLAILNNLRQKRNLAQMTIADLHKVLTQDDDKLADMLEGEIPL